MKKYYKEDPDRYNGHSIDKIPEESEERVYDSEYQNDTIDSWLGDWEGLQNGF